MPEPVKDTLIDGRYRVLSRLGAGGMADVFLAEDQQLGRKVALKLLHRRFAEDPGFVERFRREAQAAAGLQHPNVVSVYDRGTYDGTYYIAMEYLPGRSLKQLIRDEAPLDPLRAIDITIQILKAARFAHRRGVIHRDLKPHNVIVDETDHAKVTDFGIARAGASDMTETGSIMGTAQYLSPEQAQGHAVSEGSDLYSVGVVLYEMLTGRVPFDAESAVTIALKHVSEAPVAPSRINPAIAPELDQTVMWVLNKNAADRPADADQLIAVLEHCRTAIETGAAGQHTASMAAVAAAGAVAGPAAALAPPPVHAQPTTNGSGQMPAVSAAQEPPRRGWVPWALAAAVLLLVAGAATAAYFISRPKQYVVPKVTGEPLNVARTLIQDSHFQVAVISVPDPKPSGTVIGEEPGAGTRADKGSTVTLTASNGPGNVSIPSVQGLSRSQASRYLTRAGLKVTNVVVESSSQFKAGEATGTNPGAARTVAAGTAVTLLVSSGAAPKAVPAVAGETQAAATTALTQAGFNVSPQTVTSSTVTAGNVISQDPAANSSHVPGTTVTIVVAQPPPTVSVPPVTGDPLASAVGALTTAGFAIHRSTKVVRQPSEDGTVISQNP
ncbi:MAG: Stk1 family PASTA domain-containing Ser/Thr kinase, partial [Solirubrobacteraceae bacterium]